MAEPCIFSQRFGFGRGTAQDWIVVVLIKNPVNAIIEVLHVLLMVSSIHRHNELQSQQYLP